MSIDQLLFMNTSNHLWLCDTPRKYVLHSQEEAEIQKWSHFPNIPLPDSLRQEKILSESDMKKLQKQWNLYNSLASIPRRENPIQLRRALDRLEFPEWTLLHGTQYDLEILRSIKEKWVLSGEFLGIAEDGETHYCADFFRTNADYSIQQYFEYISENEVVWSLRKPKMEKSRLPTHHPLSWYVALVFSPENPIVQELTRMDAYHKGKSEMQNIVTQTLFDDNPEKQKRLSAVLVGIPANAISAIILPPKVMENEENIADIKEIFWDEVLLFDVFWKEV